MRGKGQPRQWKTATLFSKEVDKYIEHCEDKAEPITIIGFCHFGGISEAALHKNYKKTSPFDTVYTRLVTASKNDILSKALTGKYNASIAKLVLSVNHNMREEQVIKEDITVKFKGKSF